MSAAAAEDPARYSQDEMSLIESAHCVLDGCGPADDAHAVRLFGHLLNDGLPADGVIVIPGARPMSLVGMAAVKGLYATACLLLEHGASPGGLAPAERYVSRDSVRNTGRAADRDVLPTVFAGASKRSVGGVRLPERWLLPKGLCDALGRDDYSTNDLFRALSSRYGLDVNDDGGDRPVAAAILGTVTNLAPRDEYVAPAIARMRELGVLPDQRDRNGRTLLHYLFDTAAALENTSNRGRLIKQFEFLLGFGVDINARDKNGRTVLHYATRAMAVQNTGYLRDMVVWLIEQGADVNAVNKWGQTPLFEPLNELTLMGTSGAISSIHNLPEKCHALRQTVKKLASLGADITICDNDGRSLADEARGGSDSLVRVAAVNGSFSLGLFAKELPEFASWLDGEVLKAGHSGQKRRRRQREVEPGL